MPTFWRLRFDRRHPVRARQVLHHGLESPQAVGHPGLELELAGACPLIQELDEGGIRTVLDLMRLDPALERGA